MTFLFVLCFWEYNKYTMNKLIIIRGNSGSGKSTLAEALHNHYLNSSLLIEQDIVRRKMLNGEDGKALDLLKNLITYGKENYELTILEGILVSGKYEDLFDRVVNLYGKENIYAYYYDLSFEETVKRHKTREWANEFGADKMRSWFKGQDYLKNIEETKFGENVSLDDAINIVISDIECI